jgi:hypothetical protein
MKADDFEALARKAGLAKHGLGWTAWESQLERFAKLVEEHTIKSLAQPEQEPVAWMSTDKAWMWSNKDKIHDRWIGNVIPLYTSPPQRKPLNEDEMLEVLKTFYFDGTVTFGTIVRAIEKAHGIGGEHE